MKTPRLYALTVWQPWAHLIALPDEGLPAGVVRKPVPPKRVENRSWAPPRWLIGCDLAIHAGRFDTGSAAIIYGAWGLPLTKYQCPQRSIVAVATVTGYCKEGDGVMDDDPWFVGPYGWLLGNVRALPHPLVMNGAQRLWRVDAFFVEEIVEQIGELRYAA